MLEVLAVRVLIYLPLCSSACLVNYLQITETVFRSQRKEEVEFPVLRVSALMMRLISENTLFQKITYVSVGNSHVA